MAVVAEALAVREIRPRIFRARIDPLSYLMPQSQIIRSPADVSDLQATGRLDTSEPSAVR
ncbi:hypothetical protein DPMN_055276 [Dreissena polymorpha]|uniref:Uncharacterized protein n=1 Tax=Dreissena polymorpha TaxID=45954 RepID=A0A9D4CS21_DREPO|nr:hypothetical protein DPMN_085825 [Dreissena polymorpha]KAH3729308.1 hypothetical protein DPMN_055276 [Dreissena polymorpha]